MANFSEISGGIGSAGREECPACGANDWEGGTTGPLVLLQAVTPTDDLTGVGMKAMPFSCLNCSYVRLHAVTIRMVDL